MNTTLARNLFRILIFSFPMLLTIGMSGQSEINGRLLDEVTLLPLSGVQVVVEETATSTVTDASGNFVLDGDFPEIVTLIYSSNGVQIEEKVEVSSPLVSLGDIAINMTPAQIITEQVFTIQIDEDAEDLASGENISGLLSASRDVFQSSVAFVFGPMRFRLRGYESENSQMILNGIPYNDLEVGYVFWSAWGGLNDVTRNQETHVGLEHSPLTFGGAGGSVGLDLRASTQRAQTRVTYSLTNRAYRNRLMATWSSGLTPKGWAISLSASRRWAQEGYIEGTFYDAYSYFLSVDKKIGEKHLLNLVFLGAPAKRGRNGASVQEMYDLAESNYYNSYWGYQNGEKRNSRVADSHQPLGMLRHDWSFATHSVLTTTVGFQTGKYASSALDWYNAPDPRPDYYRRLPSFQDDPILAATIEELLRSDESLRQIQWDKMYQVNYDSHVTIEDVDGIEGNDVTGRQSQYIVEDRRYDNTRFTAATTLQHTISDQLSLSAGLNYGWQRNENYKVVNDLLGGEFYVNFDKFAIQDFPGNTDALQNDLNNPNQLVKEGDVFGWRYDGNIRTGSIWGQLSGSTTHLDYHVGLTGGTTSFWRTGHMRNGKFPNDSYGDSEKQKFYHGGIK